MDDGTLNIILSRFDKLDTKIDGYAQSHANLRVDVEAVKGDVSALKTAEQSRTVKEYIRFGVNFLVAAIGGFLGIQVGHQYHLPK